MWNKDHDTSSRRRHRADCLPWVRQRGRYGASRRGRNGAYRNAHPGPFRPIDYSQLDSTRLAPTRLRYLGCESDRCRSPSSFPSEELQLRRLFPPAAATSFARLSRPRTSPRIRRSLARTYRLAWDRAYVRPQGPKLRRLPQNRLE